MKDYVRIAAVTAVFLLLIPTVSFFKKRTEPISADPSAPTVKLLITETGSITELSLHDYIVGAVFAQMPADFEDSALEAQAVLAATYARRRRESELASPTKELKGADMSDDTTLYQAYFSESQARELYGSRYDSAMKKISSAADHAENRCLCFDGEPILVAFHAISFGRTESALTMWGEDIPYLTSVDSASDAALEECYNEKTIPNDELRSLLESEFTAEQLSGDPDSWISAAEQSEQDTVLKMRVGSGSYDGARFCELIGLPSQHFTFSRSDDGFIFSSSGCGHLVGMSQYGANELAKQGFSCEEILLHYFPGTVIIKDQA